MGGGGECVLPVYCNVSCLSNLGKHSSKHILMHVIKDYQGFLIKLFQQIIQIAGQEIYSLP